MKEKKHRFMVIAEHKGSGSDWQFGPFESYRLCEELICQFAKDGIVQIDRDFYPICRIKKFSITEY
jgi:hypothetical protein